MQHIADFQPLTELVLPDIGPVDCRGLILLVGPELTGQDPLHVLPSDFHRIRHYGLLANANRKSNIARARELLHQPTTERPPEHPDALTVIASIRPTFICRHCGAPMLIIETFAGAQHIRGPPRPSGST